METNITFHDLTIELTRIIQRLEREGVDLAVDDIKMVWKAKYQLGYSCPVSVEEGTGGMVSKREVEELDEDKLNEYMDELWEQELDTQKDLMNSTR